MDELVDLGDCGVWHQKWRIKLSTLFHQVWSNFLTTFSPEYRRTTYMMMAVWFSVLQVAYLMTMNLWMKRKMKLMMMHQRKMFPTYPGGEHPTVPTSLITQNVILPD
ncbi:synaptic vesicle glycoprotein 2A-like [Dicentrarchus labrax]|uniref:synaptic vesicle glycoprotein 2A-like n=1 Tax=Dicentrarchus labrax TaxID=13489 RepID=UPI0021F658A5|nr:synaptic vesicle glycoprotein 2A-like [Dicentrarchus labrax]